ncbi:hypothetical protein R3P38DRAFT_2800768 [Favolaschia claudopus]|uniref:Uncharacterized protein n=1 Tax=Favolaschia claudopus TaxID=2862362 RepID=A0AAV9ZWI9_9AGAR
MASTNNVPLDPSLDPANLPTLSPCLLQPMIGEDAGDFWQQTELGFYVPNYLYPPPTQSAFYSPQQPLPSPSPEEEFPPSIPLPSPAPLRDAMNLPRGPLPSKQASAEYTQPEKVSVHDPVLTPQPAASENSETANKKTTKPRAFTPPPKDDTDDEAGDASGSSAGGPSAEGSFNDSEGSKKKTTKKRKTDRRTDPPAVAELTQLLKADMDERREYNKENNALMHKYLDDVNDGRKEMMGLLAKLLSSDKN